MAPRNHWIWRSTECALAWREPRWRPLLLGAPRAWVHAALPGALPAAMAVTGVVAHAVTVGARLPSAHGP